MTKLEKEIVVLCGVIFQQKVDGETEKNNIKIGGTG